MTNEQLLLVLLCEFNFELVWKLPKQGTYLLCVYSEGVYLTGSMSQPVEHWDAYDTRHEAMAILLKAA